MSQTPNGFASKINIEVVNALSLIKQDNYDTFVKEYPGLANLGYITTAESLGALKYTPTRQFKHWEDSNKPLPSFTVTAGVTAAAGVSFDVTLTSDSHELAGTKSPVAIGQIWEDDATGLKYEVLSVDVSVNGAHKATLNPIKKAQTTAVTTSSFFKFIGHVNVKEGSGPTPGMVNEYQTVQLETAIMRTDQYYTDLSAFEHTVLPGGPTLVTINKDEENKKFLSTQEIQLMFGEDSDNIKSANNMNTKAKSLIQQIKEAGAVYNAPTAGVVDENFFRGLKRRASATGLTNEYHVLADTEATIKIDDFMNDYSGTGGGIIYGSFEGNKEIAINRNFGSYSIYGMTYHRKEYEYLNSARTHGADVNTGINKNSAIFIPQGEWFSPDGDAFKKFNVRWQGENESDSIVRIVTDGALFGKSNVMIGEVGMVTYKGVQAFNLQAYSYVRI